MMGLNGGISLGFNHQTMDFLMDQRWEIFSHTDIHSMDIYIYVYGYVLKNKGVVQLVCHAAIYI